MTEVNKVKGLVGQLLDSRDGVFLDWKPFLDKHFANMDAGFTTFYIFKFKNGVVQYQELGPDGEAVTVKSKVFCADPVGTRQIILRELLNLNSTSNVVEICKAKLRLPPLPQRRISKKKIENMKILYQQIPRDCRWFYPEGENVPDETFADLRARAVPHDQEPVEAQQLGSQDVRDGAEKTISKNSVGRPKGKKLKATEPNQPAIHRYFSSDKVGNAVIADESEESDEGEESDESDERDESDDEPVKSSSKKRKVFLESDSDDDFGIIIEKSLPIEADEEADTETTIDETPSSSNQPNSSYQNQTNILSPTMGSPPSDTSLVIDSMALKYLSDEELRRLGAKFNRQGATAGSKKTRPAECSLARYGLGGGQGQVVAGRDGDSYTGGHAQVRPVSLPQSNPHQITPQLPARPHHDQPPHLTPVTNPPGLNTQQEEEFSLDINHNEGKRIVMTIKRRKE